ncbi:MAG: PQQ-binding-like beta-propeller repeat protein [Phycisphaerales bacterium JB052]
MMNITKSATLALVATLSTGAANADTILFAGTQGTVHALDTDTGAITFRGVCSGPVSSMTVHENTLFLGDHNGSVYTYDLNTDLVSGAFSLNSDASAMAWLGDQLVVADSTGRIDYVDPTTGAVDHSVSNLGTDVTTIGLDAGGLFVGGHSSLAMRAHIGQDDFLFFAACGSFVQSLAFDNDTMYLSGITFFGAEEGTVYLFDKYEGGVNYAGTYPVDSDANATVAMDAMLYIAGTDGIIHEMDPDTGIIARTFETGLDIQAMTPEAGINACPADYDANGQLNFNDVSRFVDLFVNQLIPGDTNGDGEFNYFDISEFLRFYAGGC